MSIVRQRPAAPLDRFIDCFWWSERSAPLADREHMLPSGTAQLLFALHDTPILCTAGGGSSLAWTGSVIHGPQSGYYVAGPKPAGIVIGVAFHPGGAGAVIGAPLTELVDRHVPLEALWGTRAAVLRQQLQSATTPAQAFRILERGLGARLARPLLIHPAVAQALTAASPARAATPHALAAAAHATMSALPWLRIADLQRRSGYSPRHFTALFHAAVGLNPKQYFRIRRFNQAAHCLAGGARQFADVAAAAGYADQAHLIRDFREFAGVTPTHYRPAGAARPLHHRPARGPSGNTPAR